MLVALIQKVAAPSFLNGKTSEVIHTVVQMPGFVNIQCMFPGEKFPKKLSVDATCAGNPAVLADCQPHLAVIEESRSLKDKGDPKKGYFVNYWIRAIGLSDGEIMKFYLKNAKFVSAVASPDWLSGFTDVQQYTPKPKEENETQHVAPEIPVVDAPKDMASLLNAIHKR